ncbi:hypothetical protein G5I_11262 [Acromyrmex echinatior]|uniref:Uncharacterized protein n=1 Tax=Acromyrmex echinatior TaxID=103372 RepID=F4WZ48_ACREC|nr:hypothetical protein G5I_11262 [Acromyrmex echinatior]
MRVTGISLDNRADNDTTNSKRNMRKRRLEPYAVMHDSLSSERIKGALNSVARIRWDDDYTDCAVDIAEENKFPITREVKGRKRRIGRKAREEERTERSLTHREDSAASLIGGPRCTVGASGTAFVWILGRLSCLIRYGLEIRPPRADSGKGPFVQSWWYKVSLMKLTGKQLRNQNTADISRKTESVRSARIEGRSEEVVASSATSEPLSEVHSRSISLYPSRDFTGLCIILRAGTSRHRVKSGRAIISPLTAFEVYILSRHLQASRERRGQKRIRQKREGSACWIAEPRGVGARIKGAVRLEGAPNYDVTDRTRRDQVSRIQNGLLITESSSHPSDRHGGRHLLQPISASLYTLSLKGVYRNVTGNTKPNLSRKCSSRVIRFIAGIIKIPCVTSILEKHASGEEKEKSEQRMFGWEGGKINGERSHQIH